MAVALTLTITQANPADQGLHGDIKFLTTTQTNPTVQALHGGLAFSEITQANPTVQGLYGDRSFLQILQPNPLYILNVLDSGGNTIPLAGFIWMEGQHFHGFNGNAAEITLEDQDNARILAFLKMRRN